MIDFSNVSLNFMYSLLQAEDFKYLYREPDRRREAIMLAPFCFSPFDLYGIVLMHYLLHVEKLGFPTDYVRIDEEGMIPEGTLDIPRSIESGVMFTGGIAWNKQVLTRNTQVCQLIKGYCLRYGYQALKTVRATAEEMLNGTRQRSWRVMDGEERLDFTPADALTISQKLEGELNQCRESLADIKSLSAYDMDTMKINLRTGMSNYSQAFKTLLDLIVRIRALAEKGKGLTPEEGSYFAFFCKKNKDLFREDEVEAVVAQEKLRQLCLLEDETCSTISRYIRSIVLTRKMATGRIFGPSSDSSPLSRSFGFMTSMDDFSRQVFVLVYPNDFLLYNHVGEHGRVETFMDYLRIAGISEDLLLDMPAELLCISGQFVTLSDEPAKPSRYTATPPSCYITGSMYVRDSAHYFNASLDRLIKAL